MKEGKPVSMMVERRGRGEDVLDRLDQIVRESRITAVSFTALGAVGKATGGFFLGKGQYSSSSTPGLRELLTF